MCGSHPGKCWQALYTLHFFTAPRVADEHRPNRTCQLSPRVWIAARKLSSHYGATLAGNPKELSMRSFHPLLASTITSMALLAAGGAQAQTYGPQDEGRRFNDGSRVVCHKQEVANNARDNNRIAGTATGAVIGGLLGNQVGGGNGRKLATAGGAVAGGLIGRNVQGRNQERNGQRVVQTRCERVYR